MRERAARLLERLLDLLGIATVFELLPRDVATCLFDGLSHPCESLCSLSRWRSSAKVLCEVCYSGFRTLVQPVSLEESLVRGL